MAAAVPVGTEAGAVQPPRAAVVLPARYLRLAGLLLHPVRGLLRLGPGLPDHGGHRLIVSLVYGNHRGQERYLQPFCELQFRPMEFTDIHFYSA